jgi:hypothetical protein
MRIARQEEILVFMGLWTWTFEGTQMVGCLWNEFLDASQTFEFPRIQVI